MTRFEYNGNRRAFERQRAGAPDQPAVLTVLDAIEPVRERSFDAVVGGIRPEGSQKRGERKVSWSRVLLTGRPVARVAICTPG